MTGFVNLSPEAMALATTAVHGFRNAFHYDPECLVLSPGRVNVIGEHVDYNGGWVLPAAINRHTVMVARRRSDRRVRLQSNAYAEQAEFSLDNLSGGRDWTRYVRGVLAGLLEAGFDLPGFEATIDSTIPVGGGLSSSAALEASTALLGLQLAGAGMDRMAIAKLCQRAEHTYAGVPCGIMDQAAVLNATAGHLLLLDCRAETFTQAPFATEDWRLMIIHSMVAHELASGEYGKRRAACHDAAHRLGLESLRELSLENLPTSLAHPALTPEMQRCVRHVVSENDRVLRTVEALARGDFTEAGAHLKASHASLRDDYRVSCPELDFIAAHLSAQPDVAGCRMTGGGFGGSCIALVRTEAVQGLETSIRNAYEAAYNLIPDVFCTTPQASAVTFSATELTGL